MPISEQQICFNLSVKRKKTLPVTIQIIDIIENHKPRQRLRHDQPINIYWYLASTMHVYSSTSGYGEQISVWWGSQVTLFQTEYDYVVRGKAKYFRPCYSTCGPLTSNTGITWELDRHVNLSSTPSSAEWNLRFKEIPRWWVCLRTSAGGPRGKEYATERIRASPEIVFRRTGRWS